MLLDRAFICLSKKTNPNPKGFDFNKARETDRVPSLREAKACFDASMCCCWSCFGGSGAQNMIHHRSQSKPGNAGTAKKKHPSLCLKSNKVGWEERDSLLRVTWLKLTGSWMNTNPVWSCRVQTVSAGELMTAAHLSLIIQLQPERISVVLVLTPPPKKKNH